jgi:hypothetical protein
MLTVSDVSEGVMRVVGLVLCTCFNLCFLFRSEERKMRSSLTKVI